jgi:uncharacterized protein (TIGR00369 family)
MANTKCSAARESISRYDARCSSKVLWSFVWPKGATRCSHGYVGAHVFGAHRVPYTTAMPRMNAAELDRLIVEHFPQAKDFCQIVQLTEEAIELRMPFRETFLRPGGTISGPALMSLADTVAYYLILSQIGPAVLAVTTSLNINFLRKPVAQDVIATGRLLKLGRQLAVVDVSMRSVSSAEAVAQATVTYSIPPGTR